MEEVTTRTIDAAGLTAVRAYAALRARSPGRTSFLLEMTAPDERGEQRSTIGFLTKRESAYPAAAPVLAELAALAGQAAAPAPPALEHACSADVVMIVAFDAVLPALGVQPWPDQPYVAREMRDLASVVLDHAAGTITITASHPNVVERCARVLAEASELPDLPPAGGDRPEYGIEHPPDTALAKQVARAERRLALGGIERLVLPRTFKSQARGADPLDAYRALREAAPGRYAFFVDLAASPMFGALAVAATGDTAVRVSAGEGAAAELLALFPIGAVAGAPAVEALGAMRDLDTGARGMRGGALARVRPGGHVEMIRADTVVTFEEEQLQAHGVAEVVPGRDAQAHAAAAEEDARAGLRAIRRAQDAADLRAAATGAPG